MHFQLKQSLHLPSLITWSFFSYSLLMLGKLFSLHIILAILVFNVMAAGYLFYFTIKHESFASVSTYGVSMLIFNILIFGFDFCYCETLLIDGYQARLQSDLLYPISNALILPPFYLILRSNTKNAIKKYSE